MAEVGELIAQSHKFLVQALNCWCRIYYHWIHSRLLPFHTFPSLRAEDREQLAWNFISRRRLNSRRSHRHFISISFDSSCGTRRWPEALTNVPLESEQPWSTIKVRCGLHNLYIRVAKTSGGISTLLNSLLIIIPKKCHKYHVSELDKLCSDQNKTSEKKRNPFKPTRSYSLSLLSRMQWRDDDWRWKMTSSKQRTPKWRLSQVSSTDERHDFRAVLEFGQAESRA